MRKIILYGIILFQIALIVSLIRGIQLSKKSASRIASMQEVKVKLEAEREKLKKEEEYIKSEYYLEKVARDELHLSKPGETVVIVPENRLQVAEVGKITETKTEKPNWIKWWEVMSGRI